MFDLFNKLKLTRGLSPVDGGDNTDLVSQIVDMQGYNSLLIEIASGVLADPDAVFSVLVEDGDSATLTDNAPIAAASLQLDAQLVTLAQTPEATMQTAFTFASDQKVFKIGVLNCKRYVRVTISPATNTGSDPLAVTFIQGNARHNSPTPEATQVP